VILAYADCSLDHPIVSVGYVLCRAENGDESLIETGTRVLNANQDDRAVNWTSGRAEYYGAIIATRAALDYTDEQLILHLDNEGIVKAIKQGSWYHEDYFPHALFSFVCRFEDYHVRLVHRMRNEKAHEQARVGLRVGRELHEGTL